MLIAASMLWPASASANPVKPSILSAAYSQTPRLALPLDAAPSLQDVPRIKLTSNMRHVRLDGIAQYWLDPDTQTSISAMLSRSSAGKDLFQASSQGDVHAGHGKTLWLRFEIEATEPRARWLLELGSPLIDDAQLFWQSPQGPWMTLAAGDKVQREQWPLPTRLPTFLLSENSAPTVYYMRLQNARAPISLPLVLYSEQAHMQSQQLSSLLLGGLLGLIVLVLVSSAVLMVAMRDKAFAAYLGYLLALGAFMLTNTGLTPQYLWPQSPLLADRMNYALAGLISALAPWLVRLIVQPAMRRQLVDWITAVLAVSMLIIAVIELLAPSIWSYQLVNLGALVAVLVIYSIVASAWQRGDRITRWIALCFAPVAIAAVPLILRNLGLISTSWLTQNSLLIAASLEMPLLLYTLFLRSSQRREMKARADGLPLHDPLTNLPNTRQLLQQMHGCQMRAERFSHQYGLILVELINHDWFDKEHGREMADRAIILSSTRLQTIVRDIDCVSRLDKSQFVILVEGHCSTSTMTKLAARVSASAHQPSEILPVGASLKFRITCALLPNEQAKRAGDDASSQLGWLIDAADKLPLDAHKSMRTIGF
jgi:two-component system, sensor histidine kinase LadS